MVMLLCNSSNSTFLSVKNVLIMSLKQHDSKLVAFSNLTLWVLKYLLGQDDYSGLFCVFTNQSCPAEGLMS